MAANDNWYTYATTAVTTGSTSIPYMITGGGLWNVGSVVYGGGGGGSNFDRTLYRHPDGSVNEVPPAPKTALERLDERIMATCERARKALAVI
jgi:hypothetical protein